MKYLKVTLAIFVASFIFGIYNANASQSTTLVDITIPKFQGVYSSSQKQKWSEANQWAIKTECKDKVSGDGRAIKGRVQGMLSENKTTDWIILPLNEWKKFDSPQANSIGLWRLQLKSNKWLATEARYTGVWQYD